ncbi:Integral membrane protein [Frankia sp. AiPs1]|uniref:DUF3817 domain-containing protein n=1 Tax=Frankia sp. AiPa1 TaxID=573492 RepID=UPI00202B4710|nr:DUF3817 domain-containing protein [Frankia sp. AiPa1]MCL9761903.1 DUF3817 domain-containing protein [Frankia sp. AiPa1]
MTAIPSSSPSAAGRCAPAAVRGALLRYRAIAYVVGVGLIILVCIGMPLKYAAGSTAVVAIVGPVHGVLYIVYLAATYDLATRCRIPLVRAVLVMLAGTIPFLSFVAERKVTGMVRRQYLADAAKPATPGRPGPGSGAAGGVGVGAGGAAEATTR